MKKNKRVAWNKGLSGEEYLKHYPKGIKELKVKSFQKRIILILEIEIG